MTLQRRLRWQRARCLPPSVARLMLLATHVMWSKRRGLQQQGIGAFKQAQTAGQRLPKPRSPRCRIAFTGVGKPARFCSRPHRAGASFVFAAAHLAATARVRLAEVAKVVGTFVAEINNRVRVAIMGPGSLSGRSNKR